MKATPTKRRLAAVAAAAALALCCFAGCSSSTSESASDSTMPEKLVYGAIDSGDTTEALAATRTAFYQEMEEAIGIPVEIFSSTDYAGAIEAMASKNVQITGLGAFEYTEARERAGAQALVAREADGALGYYCYFITRKDSGIEKMSDLKGRSFAFVEPNSTSGNIIACDQILDGLANTADKDVTFDQLHENNAYFSAPTYAGSQNNAIMAVFNGDSDAGCCSSAAYQRAIDAGKIDPDEMVILAQSPLIPANVICVDPSLPQELKDKLTAFLTSYDDEAYWLAYGAKEGQKWAWVPANESDYDYIEVLREKYNLTD